MTAASITWTVMLGTALLGATAGVIGSFAVLRRRALVGDMLSHAALPGICLAFLWMGSRDLLGLSIGALATGLVGIGVVTLLVRWTRIKEDAAIGIVLSTFFGAGVVLLSVAQRSTTGNQAGLDKYLFGETAGMRASDVRLLLATALAVLLVVLLFYKEFKLLSFDPDFAAAQGWPTLALDMAMMAALAVVTIVGLPICGVILMAAMIILPSAGARFWTDRLGPLLMIAGLAGAAAGVVGTFVASPLPEQWLGLEAGGPRGLPPGPLIVLTGTFFFLLSLFFAPRHGLVARTWAELRLRMRIAREHLLRAMYELSEPRLPERPFLDERQLLAHRAWSKWFVEWWLHRAEFRGLVERRDAKIRLTPRGLSAAAEVTKTHRLWELYLMESAGVAADHVDRDADAVEHVLPRPLIADLERRLVEAGRMPVVPKVVPESPHELMAE